MALTSPTVQPYLAPHKHEGADPDELLEHGALEGDPLQDLAGEVGNRQPVRDGLSVLAVGGREALGVHVGLSVRGGVAELRHSEVDEDLGVVAEAGSVQPGPAG